MTKHIELVLSGAEQTIAVAELREDLAPKSCQALWDVLPVEGKAIHGRWGGSEVWMGLPPIKLTEYENETIFPAPGDILLVRIAPNVFDFAIFYGKGWCFGPTGFVPGNHFATIEKDLAGFAKGCEQVLQRGATRLTIQRK